MPLKFRLKGLAETFIDALRCPCCGNDGGESGDDKFATDLTRVTFDGIVVVATCQVCSHVFLPETRRCGVISRERLRQAVERDSITTGAPILNGIPQVRMEVERLIAERSGKLQ